MRIINIEQIEKQNKIINNDSINNKVNIDDKDNYILWLTNIFLDEQKNKYRNTKPIPCVIKRGSRFNINDSNYCLFLLRQNIHNENYIYNIIEKIDEILLTGKAVDRGNIKRIHSFPHLKLFTTKKEAYSYINDYKNQNNLKKYKEKLSRINTDIEILMKEKERLENLIIQIEENESNN